MTRHFVFVLYGVMICTALSQAACAPSSGVVRGSLEAMSRDERLQTFDSTARALDEKPEFVDEFYRIARRHPAMFRRFLANTTRDLVEPGLAHDTVRLL